MRDRSVTQSILEYLRSVTIVGISLYASILTILSVNDQIKPFLSIPTKIEEMEKKILDHIDKVEIMQNNMNKVVKKINDPFLIIPEKIDEMRKNIYERIDKIEVIQNKTNKILKEINNSSTVAHADIFDENGYKTIKVRVTGKEKHEIDKNSIYYDAQSGFFPQLAKGRNIQDYKVLLKNDDNILMPEIMVKIRGRSNQYKNKKNNVSNICFEVSKSIYETLGGKNNKKYLEVKAKVIPLFFNKNL